MIDSTPNKRANKLFEGKMNEHTEKELEIVRNPHTCMFTVNLVGVTLSNITWPKFIINFEEYCSGENRFVVTPGNYRILLKYEIQLEHNYLTLIARMGYAFYRFILYFICPACVTWECCVGHRIVLQYTYKCKIKWRIVCY